MKNNIKEITILIIILMIIIIIGMAHKKYENEKIFELKFEIQKKEIEKIKISEDERKIIDMKREKDKKSEELKEVSIMKKEITEIEGDLILNKECLKIQIQRVFDEKEVVEGYCDRELVKKTPETTKTAPVSDPIKKKVRLTAKENFKIKKSNLFLCLEIKNIFGLKNDENRCATMMTMVGFLETQYGKTGIGPTHNNIYGIKNPTDKKGLLGNWKKAEANNIIFENQEMSSYAFAYYYSKYHNHRNMDQFVDRWVAWDNQKYKVNLKANYDWIYNEYANLLK